MDNFFFSKSKSLLFFAVRDAKHTNFVEFRNFKIIYRRYAGLYFCICVDVSDNNLFYLEAIHNFVEVRQYIYQVLQRPCINSSVKKYPFILTFKTQRDIGKEKISSKR